MNDFSAQGASAPAQSASTFPPSKSPRDTFRRLAIESSHDPEILPRALGIIAQQSLVPAAISFDRDDQFMWLEVIVEGLDDRVAGLLCGRIERIVGVVSVATSSIRPATRLGRC